MFFEEKLHTIKYCSKKIFRWEHEEIVENHLEKMKTNEAKNILKQRGSIVDVNQTNIGVESLLSKNRESFR